MAGRTTAEAANQFLGRGERWLSCVTRGNQLIIDGYDPGVAHSVASPGGRPISLRSGSADALMVRYWVNFRESGSGRSRWDLQIVGYSFALHAANSRELFAYHWHPEPGFVSFPHLHVAAQDVVNRRMHLPTGPLGLNDSIAFLIREYDVIPLRGDWEQVLRN